MSVDPIIQAPTNSQSINPYSYIMNNPLSGTDPTGYFSSKDTMTGSRIKGVDTGASGASFGAKFSAANRTPANRSTEVTVKDNGAGSYTLSKQVGANKILDVDIKVNYNDSGGGTPGTDGGSGTNVSEWTDQDGNPTGGPSNFNGTETACVCLAGGIKGAQQTANDEAAAAALQKGVNNLKENIRGKTEATESEDELYGPFYRYEKEQKWVDQALEQGMLYGQQPTNGGAWPEIQAYRKDISPYKPGKIEFYTTVKPTSGGGPIQHWYPNTPGVVRHDSKTIKIPIVVHAAIPVDQLIR